MLFLPRIFTLFLLLLVSTTTLAAEGDSVIIVLNERNPTQSVKTADLKAIYSGQTSFWHGVVPMKVIALHSSSTATKMFLEDVLGISYQRYQQGWSARELSGQGIAPTVAADAEEVIKRVRENPGGIGFIGSSDAWSQAPDGVKFVEIRQ